MSQVSVFEGENNKGRDIDVFQDKFYKIIDEVYINKLKKGIITNKQELDKIDSLLTEIETILPLKTLEEENSKLELFFKHIDRLENQYEDLSKNSQIDLKPFEKK